METISAINQFVQAYKSNNITIEDFLNEVSNVYHQLESKDYDKKHIDINENEQYILACIEQKVIISANQKIKILDFGCGTGFATQVILNSNFLQNVENITLFDLSPDMVELAKEKLNNAEVPLFYFENTQGLTNLMNQKFDLVITNAVVHHIPELKGFFEIINNLVKHGGYYLLSHEPNANFYTNNTLKLKSNQFRKFKKTMNYLNINYWLFKFKIKKKFKNFAAINILAETNNLLLKKGILAKPLPEYIIPKLIDVHVPLVNFDKQPWGEPGFNANEIIEKYLPQFKIKFVSSYTHIKDEAILHYKKWMEKDKNLREQFPLDGADVLMLFKKE